jgi:hypothetical protein
MPLNPDLADFLELANQNSQPNLQQQGANLARESYDNATLFLDGECEIPYQDYNFSSSNHSNLTILTCFFMCFYGRTSKLHSIFS